MKKGQTKLAFKKNEIQNFIENGNDLGLDSFEKNVEITSNLIKNGLGSAIGFPEFGFQGISCGAQLSQLDTAFKNERWYLVSNMRQILSEMYVEHGPVQNVVNIPVNDAFRGGLEITSKQLSEDEIEHLRSVLEDNKESLDDGTENIDLIELAQAEKWKRLYGGAGVIIITDQDYSSPLNINSLNQGDYLEFRAVDLWELFYSKMNIEDYHLETQDIGFEYYDYYGKKLHKSRVLKLKGLRAPSFIRPKLRGWGVSVVEHLVRSLNQYLKSNNLSFELLDELKIDVFKFEGLNAAVQNPVGEEKIRKRAQMTNWQKNFQHAIIMDSKEDFTQKELSLSFLPETMREIRIQLASDVRMPLTKFFGISSAGFNSGEDEIENYNGMVESEIRTPIKPYVLKMAQLRCKVEFGFIPTDLKINFKPLRVLGSVEQENVNNSKFSRIAQARQMGEIDSKEFRDACNRDNLLGIKLDINKNILTGEESNVMDIIPEENNQKIIDKTNGSSNLNSRISTGYNMDNHLLSKLQNDKPHNDRSKNNTLER